MIGPMLHPAAMAGGFIKGDGINRVLCLWQNFSCGLHGQNRK